MKFFITHSQYYDIRKMNQFLIKNCCSVSFSHYIFWWGMNMMYKMQLIFFGLLILALEFQLPFHFQIWYLFCYFRSHPSRKGFLLKYKSTVSHQLSGPTMLQALESQICVVIVLQKEFNRTMTCRRSTELSCLCVKRLRDKKPILKRNLIKNWQNMNLMLHNCF